MESNIYEANQVAIFYDNGSGRRTECWYKENMLHREILPALIQYREDGSILFETWLLNGVVHREGGPAHMDYHLNGNVYQIHWSKNGTYHRIDGPASIVHDDDGSILGVQYFVNGNLIEDEEEIKMFDTEEGRVFLTLKYGK